MRRTLAAIVALTICALAALPAHGAQLAFVSATNPDAPVAIEGIAHRLGWTFRRTADGAVIDDGSGPQILRIGSRLVDEDGSDVALFDHPASVRNGHVELALGDAATLFHLDVQRLGTNVELVSQSGDDADVREVPRPATPPPAPVATPRPATYSPPPVVSGNAGTLALSVEFDGSNRIYQTSLDGSAGVVRGALSSYGSAAVTNPVGSVTVGPPARYAGFGTISNPLAGSVISNGSLTGVTAHLANGTTDYDIASGSSIAGNVYALSRTSGPSTDALAYVTGYGDLGQAIVRHAVVATEPWGTLDYEALVGQHGSGEGIHARTKGKTFVEANLSATAGALPVQAGDVPSGAVIGEHLSSVTTVTAGYVRSIASPGSPTIGVATRWNGLSLATNVSEHWTNLTAGYAGSTMYGQFFASAGAQKIFGLTGGVGLHHALAEVDLTSSGGATSGIAQLRTNHAGINLAAGFQLNDGTARPLIGVVLPVAPSLSLEAGIVDGPSGRPALRIAVLAGFRQPKPRVATFPVTVFVPDPQQYGPLRVFVDGVPSAAPFTQSTSVMVPAGRHSVYVESADHGYGSPTLDVTAGSAPAGAPKLAVTLFPQRSIAGTVRFGGAADSIPAEASLQGIRVVLEPSGESATTDAAGNFVFARAPYDPASTILLDPTTVPSGFAAPDALPIAAGPATVTLAPLRKVEHTSFH
ncbi:MAG: hypothetical protein ABSH03_07260 [Candidatus Lustribacter sp.]|jgi:hypothetical protein